MLYIVYKSIDNNYIINIIIIIDAKNIAIILLHIDKILT